jgi:hypothetical protein
MCDSVVVFPFVPECFEAITYEEINYLLMLWLMPLFMAYLVALSG